MSGVVRFVPTIAIREAMNGREITILKKLGIGWTGKVPHINCPYPDHPDKNPSWRWNDKKQRAHCSCVSSADIFTVIGKMRGGDFDAQKLAAAELLGRTDLIRDKRGKLKISAIFAYTDESGEVLFQVVRYEPKAFSQRSPDGKGGWIEGKGAMRGVRISSLPAA